MIEYINKEPRTKQRKITIHKSQVLYDMDAMTYKLSEVAIDGDSGDKFSTDTEDRLDGTIVSQFIESREALLRKRLAFCLVPEEILEVDNMGSLDADYVFNFILPQSFNDGDLRPAMKFMHDYIVRGALADWYTSLGTNYGIAFAQQAETDENMLLDIFRVPGFVRHPGLIAQKSYKIR